MKEDTIKNLFLLTLIIKLELITLTRKYKDGEKYNN